MEEQLEEDLRVCTQGNILGTKAIHYKISFCSVIKTYINPLGGRDDSLW